MRKLLIAIAIAALATQPLPALAGQINAFELQGLVSSIGGDYDENGQWVVSNILLYGSYEGATWHNRVWCEPGACGTVPPNACAHVTGYADQGVLHAETVVILPRGDCYS